MMSELVREIKLGNYYVLAPENPCTGWIPAGIESIWQYGSNEKPVSQGGDPIWLQDGVAPQCPINNIGNRRVYIPQDGSTPRGFKDSHSVLNFGWIFNKQFTDNGYVKARK